MNVKNIGQEMELLDFIKQIMSKWWLILLFMIGSGGISYYLTLEYIVPEYQARTTLFIGKETELLSGISLSDISVDNKLVIDYRELMKTRLVTSEVIEQLGLNTTSGHLIDNLGVQIVPESRFMHLTFDDPVPERATLIINTISEELADKAKTIVGVDNIKIVDYAEVPIEPISPNILLNILLAMVIGAVIAIGIIIIRIIMNNTIHTEEDMENSFGVPVLGVIPKFKGEVY